MTDTISSSVERHAVRCPERLALVSGQTSLTYAQLQARVLAAAHWLRSEAVVPGARVMIPAGPGDPWFAVAYLATHLVGAIAVPVDAKVSPRNRGLIAAQASPTLVLMDDTLARFRAAIAQPALHAEIQRDRSCDESSIADVLFTSGSTGTPKGVALSHRNVMAATRNIVSFVGNGPDDREVVTVPLSHSFGLGRMRCTFFVGGTLILVPGLSFPALVFRALEEHSATGLSCVPAGVAVLLRQGTDRLARFAGNLRYMEFGSAPMDIGTKRELAQLLPQTRICMHYGLTEASRSTFLEFHADARHLDSVGRATGCVQMRIVREDGGPAAPGEVGHIQIRSDTVMSHYWNDEGATRRVLSADGWFDTGDLGHVDAEGYLYFAGRNDDVINVGGRKVHPLAIEELANSFPGVAESGCAGISDPDGILGEVPALWVVEQSADAVDPTGLLGAIARDLESYAIPRRVFKVAELPRTDSGKLRRGILRAQASGA